MLGYIHFFSYIIIKFSFYYFKHFLNINQYDAFTILLIFSFKYQINLISLKKNGKK